MKPHTGHIEDDARVLAQLIDEGPRPITAEICAYLSRLIYEQFLGIGETLIRCDSIKPGPYGRAVKILAIAVSDLAYLRQLAVTNEEAASLAKENS